MTECPCCNAKPAPCPFCGKPGKIYGENNVGCSDWECGANVDWGHWCGEDDHGIPAVHHVIGRWNRRCGIEITDERIDRALRAYWGGRKGLTDLHKEAMRRALQAALKAKEPGA